MDICVHNSISYGLPETVENLIQEAGRPMRGSAHDIEGLHGFAFFLHKGSLGDRID